MEDNTAYGAKYWWHNGAQNKNQKTPKTWNTLRYSVYPTDRNPAQSLQENAITVFGPRLYNSLPKYLTDIERVKTENFKFELDKFLELITAEPKMPNCVTASGSNSILDQLTHLRAQVIYRSCGVIDSAMEQRCFETTPSIQVHRLSLLMHCARAVSLKKSTSQRTTNTIQNYSKLIYLVMRIELTRAILMPRFSNFQRNININFLMWLYLVACFLIVAVTLLCRSKSRTISSPFTIY